MAGGAGNAVPPGQAVGQDPGCADPARMQPDGGPGDRGDGRSAGRPGRVERGVRRDGRKGRAAHAHRGRPGAAGGAVSRRCQGAPGSQRGSLGCYGDLLECVWLAVDRAGAHLDPASADLLDALGDHVCDVWTEPDCGIWELDERRHNTFSKVGCWVALDRLIRLSERGQVSDRDVDRWQAERRAIREWVDTHCWSGARRSYAGRAGSDDLDASLLLLARTGFVDGKDPRFTGTIKAIRAELAEGPLLYRFSGAREIEGAFVACSFWLVDALVRNGHARRARKLWHELIAHVSDLGLLAEEIDPATGPAHGHPALSSDPSSP